MHKVYTALAPIKVYTALALINAAWERRPKMLQGSAHIPEQASAPSTTRTLGIEH